MERLGFRNGLKSCRSHPIFSSTGTVLGTFALYHKNLNDPVLASPYQVELTTHIAGIAIERKIIESRENEWREKMEKINSELQHALKIRDESLSITSHELNSPLATLKMRLEIEKEMLQDGEVDRGSIINLLNYQEQQIDKVLNLLRTLMDSSNFSRGEQSLKKVPLDLRHLIHEVGEKIQPMLIKTGCSPTPLNTAAEV